jgi:hypothetical protein
MVQKLHIQQAKLEAGSGAYQLGKKMEEAGIQLAEGQMEAMELS